MTKKPSIKTKNKDHFFFLKKKKWKNMKKNLWNWKKHSGKKAIKKKTQEIFFKKINQQKKIKKKL